MNVMARGREDDTFIEGGKKRISRDDDPDQTPGSRGEQLKGEEEQVACGKTRVSIRARSVAPTVSCLTYHTCLQNFYLLLRLVHDVVIYIYIF